MLNTEERMEVAKNVIELCGVEDEDLKQEIYLSALEFQKKNPDDIYENCKSCGKVKCIQCLSDRLMELTRTYNEKMEETAAYENSVPVNLQHFDDLIFIHMIRSRF